MNRKIVAVGTTAIRTLESLPYLWRELTPDIKKSFDAKTCKYWDMLIEVLEKQNWIHKIEESPNLNSLCFETSIYITPGYTFKIVNDIITNFHL